MDEKTQMLILKLALVGTMVFSGIYLLLTGEVGLGVFMTYLGAFFGGFVMGEMKCRP